MTGFAHQGLPGEGINLQAFESIRLGRWSSRSKYHLSYVMFCTFNYFCEFMF